MDVISFIVPAHNEEGLIGATVRSLHHAAAGLEHEVIVVDDASSDRTAEVAAGHGARAIRVEHRHIAATRNAGAKASTGQMLVFVDADTTVPREALKQAVLALERGAIGGGAGVKLDAWVPVYARVMLWVMIRLFRMFRLTGGCFLFCTREAFDASGGWDERYYVGEEIHLCKALHKLGEFVIIRERVVTSGRKLRTYSAGEVLGTMWRLAKKGMKGGMTREGTELWYGERRDDPLSRGRSSVGTHP
jgi:glycosyltransferase involved in cell wall biosynthesis